MASEPKTKRTKASVAKFLAAIADDRRRDDCARVAELMQNATGEAPAMWGENMVGFGTYHYRYATGTEGDWPIVAFSPRKNDLTLYLMSGFDAQGARLARLGKHKLGKSCLYLKKLDDVDVDVLAEMIDEAVRAMELQRVRHAT